MVGSINLWSSLERVARQGTFGTRAVPGSQRVIDLERGQQLRSYVLQEEIARGGMGVVWRATDKRTGAVVALKAVANDLVGLPDFHLRMQDEARRHQRLQHPNIVRILDVFEAAGRTVICMELIEGLPLTALLDAAPQRRLDPARAIEIMKGVLSALDYAHRNLIVHRDVKPSNILLDDREQPRLIDFGIAVALAEERRTRMGQVIGTPLYMSPEQILKPTEVRHLSDVYGAACVLYEMVTGRPPFVPNSEGVADTDFAVQQAHITRIPRSAKARVPTLPRALDRVIMTGLNKDPQHRIPGCAEFSARLEIAQATLGGVNLSPLGLGLAGALVAVLAALGLLMFCT